MSFILKDKNGIGTEGFTDTSLDGYRDMARYLVGLYDDHKISKCDNTGNTPDVLKYFGAKDIDELRYKIY